MPITLKKVAQESGMSIQTVSYVLNDKAHLFRPETRKKVLAAAQKLGYRANTSAKAMRSGRFDGIALVLSTDKDRSHVPYGLLDGIQAALTEKDMHLTLVSLPDETLSNEGFVPKILRQLMTDGLLINYTNQIPQQMIDLIEGYKIPSVWLNTDRNEGVVRPDDRLAVREATEALLAKGHKKIAYVDYHNDHTNLADKSLHYSVAARYAGYADAMSTARLPTRAIWENRRVPAAERIQLASQWLGRSDRPTAVVAYSPWSAVPVLLAATTRCGLSVPSDLSLITFSDLVFEDMGVAISTMLLPETELGREAVQMLLEKIRTPGSRHAPRLVPMKYLAGETIAPPRLND